MQVRQSNNFTNPKINFGRLDFEEVEKNKKYNIRVTGIQGKLDEQDINDHMKKIGKPNISYNVYLDNCSIGNCIVPETKVFIKGKTDYDTIDCLFLKSIDLPPKVGLAESKDKITMSKGKRIIVYNGADLHNLSAETIRVENPGSVAVKLNYCVIDRSVTNRNGVVAALNSTIASSASRNFIGENSVLPYLSCDRFYAKGGAYSPDIHYSETPSLNANIDKKSTEEIAEKYLKQSQESEKILKCLESFDNMQSHQFIKPAEKEGGEVFAFANTILRKLDLGPNSQAFIDKTVKITREILPSSLKEKYKNLFIKKPIEVKPSSLISQLAQDFTILKHIIKSVR